MVSEITVIVKDEEKTLRTKTLAYESYSMHQDDPILSECVKMSVNEFKGTPTSVKIKVSMEVV